jgi:THO complex subunit 2
VLLQFHEFIVSNLDLRSFETLLPSFRTIVKEYGIDPSVAFYLWRPILAEKIRYYDVEVTIQEQKKKLLQGRAAGEKSANGQEEASSASTAVDEATEAAPTRDSPHEGKDDVEIILTPNSEV